MKELSIYSWNINGIRASKTILEDWLTDYDPDILCLQEIKANIDQIPKNLTQLNYNLSIHSAKKKGYSGVLNFSKENPLEIKTSIGVEEFDNEGRIIMTKYDEFVLFNVYFPNGKKNKDRLDYKMRFYEQFLNVCKNLLDKGEKIIVCGDVNTAHKEQDLANPKPNSKYSGFLPEERKWIDRFLEIGFVDTYRHIHGDGEGNFTWWTLRTKTAKQNNIGWRLDYFYISNNLLENLVDASIYPDIKGSDHCPISIKLKF